MLPTMLPTLDISVPKSVLNCIKPAGASPPHNDQNIVLLDNGSIQVAKYSAQDSFP